LLLLWLIAPPASAGVAVDPPSSGVVDVSLSPPVAGPIVRHFEPPMTRWGPGHRGIDFVVPPGTFVRAPASGQVVFAGSVATTAAVTIDHGAGVVSTVSSLQEIAVARGAWVARGDILGTSGMTHPDGAPGVHLGVRDNGAYVDPSEFLEAVDVSAAIHLAPVTVPLAERVPSVFGAVPSTAGSYERACASPPPLEARPPIPPNDNIAVAVAGIGSSTESGLHADMYEHGPESLGYPNRRVYRFSYEGTDGPRLHRPYKSAATFVSIEESAMRLRDLLLAIAREHPGHDVDLIAHSQGGVIARTFLELYAADEALPRVEHLVTFSSPHSGAPLGEIARALDSSPLGRLANGVVGRWARAGGPVPDPRSDAVRDLTPGSALMGRLVQRTLPLGTRASALGIANDLVVPAAATAIPGFDHHVVGPHGLNGHSGVLTSPGARAIAYSSLRDGPPSCHSTWDTWGPRAGRAISWVETGLARALEMVDGPW
jgi:hypothetical protein